MRSQAKKFEPKFILQKPLILNLFIKIVKELCWCFYLEQPRYMIRASPRLLEKKEKEQIRKKSKEPKVASYKPVKFLNPYKSYTCGSVINIPIISITNILTQDFYLVVEKDEQILFSPDWLKEVSYVNEVMYHPVKKQIILKLGHLQQFPIDWW